MDRGNLTREQLDEILRPLLADENDRRGHARNNHNEMWVQVAGEHGELYNVFAADVRPVVAPPVEAPADPRASTPAPEAEDVERQGIILAAVANISREIGREEEAIWDPNDDDEDTNDDAEDTEISPAIVDTYDDPTVDLVDDDAEGEALNTAILPAIVDAGLVSTLPAIVDAGLVSTVRLLDNGDGSGPALAPTLEVRVARQTK